MRVFNCKPRKKHSYLSEIELEFLVFNVQEHNLLSGCSFGPFTYVSCEICISCLSVFSFLSLTVFYLDHYVMEIPCYSNATY